MELVSSIIDRPRLKSEKDLFGIDKYQEALVNFIKKTATPITIAIQGEWGSGKTSLMNVLRSNLCEESDGLFYDVWLNTWQYSLMRSQEETLMRIIAGLTQKVLSIIRDKHESKVSDVSQKITSGLKSLFKGVAKIGISAIGNQLGVENAGDIVDEVFASKDSKDEEAIVAIRSGLEEAITRCLQLDAQKGSPKRGFVFFIDDLDRIDPPVAVQILELLKNIFDIPQCIFVLAIDYDVVIKGLKPKFGELTAQNEREFRCFFDKIIQLPFSMPTNSYQVNGFIAESVDKISLLEENENNGEVISHLSEMASLSVGTNPRALKRLMNTLSLIQILNTSIGKSEKQATWEKLINFGLVCTQIAYPSIYSMLVADPNFKRWGSDLLKKHKVAALSEDEKQQLSGNNLFDEEWEQTLYQICQKDVYLSNRVFLISSLLNKIASLIPENENLGDIVEQILEFSAITNVDATDKPKSALPNKRGELKAVLWQRIEPYMRQNLQDLPAPKTISGVESEKAGIWIVFTEDVFLTFSISLVKNAIKVSINSPLILSPYKQKKFMEVVEDALSKSGLRSDFERIAQSNTFDVYDNGIVEQRKDKQIGTYWSVQKLFPNVEILEEEENIAFIGKMIADYAIFRKKVVQFSSNIKAASSS
jgi:hypothetical protein